MISLTPSLIPTNNKLNLKYKILKVILGSWPAPSDEWTEEHVLGNIESRPVNLVSNRTSSLQKLANRRPDVVVFGDAPLDAKTYFLAFGRVAPVQARDSFLRVLFFRPTDRRMTIQAVLGAAALVVEHHSSIDKQCGMCHVSFFTYVLMAYIYMISRCAATYCCM